MNQKLIIYTFVFLYLVPIICLSDKAIPSVEEELTSYGYSKLDLDQAYKSEEIRIRRLAAKESLSNKYVLQKKEMLNDEDDWIRVYAAGSLLILGEIDGLNVLEDALMGTDIDIAVESARSLYNVDDKKSVVKKQLSKLLSSPNPHGKISAIRVVQEIFVKGDWDDELVEALSKMALNSKNLISLRQVSLEVLSDLYDNSIVKFTAQKLHDDPDPLIKMYVESIGKKRL